MARPPKRARNRLLQGAVALGGGAIRRVLNFKSAKKGSVAARMAKKYWRDDAQPARDPLLRRAVAHAGGAFEAMLLRGRRALAVIRNLPQHMLRLVPEFLLRLLRLRQPCLPQRAQTPLPPPPPPPPPKHGAWLFRCPPPRPATSTTPPPSSPPPKSSEPERETFVRISPLFRQILHCFFVICYILFCCCML
jgi:hypothetical protein